MSNDEHMSPETLRKLHGVDAHEPTRFDTPLAADQVMRNAKAGLRRQQPENDLTIACVDYYRTQRLAERGRCLMWHTPNQVGSRSYYDAAVLKRMGVLPGVADFLLMLPGGRIAAIELKAEKGRQSPAQREFQVDCLSFGVPYRIVRTPEEFEAELVRLGVVAEDERVLSGGVRP